MARSIIMFDMDGTLADTMPQLTEYFVGVGIQFGRTETGARELAPQIVGLPPSQLPDGIAKLIGRELSDLPESTRQSLLTAFVQLPVVLFPEVRPTLEALKSKRYTLVFSSSTPQVTVTRRLEAVGLESYFDVFLGTDHPNGLTKAEHPRMARQALDLKEDQFAVAAVYVGDGVGDMQIAKAAGIAAIGRLTGDNREELRAAGADEVIKDLTQLESALAKL